MCQLFLLGLFIYIINYLIPTASSNMVSDFFSSLFLSTNSLVPSPSYLANYRQSVISFRVFYSSVFCPILINFIYRSTQCATYFYLFFYFWEVFQNSFLLFCRQHRSKNFFFFYPCSYTLAFPSTSYWCSADNFRFNFSCCWIWVLTLNFCVLTSCFVQVRACHN